MINILDKSLTKVRSKKILKPFLDELESTDRQKKTSIIFMKKYSVEELRNIFNKLLENSPINFGYHYLNQLFNNIENGYRTIINLITETLNAKIKSINDSINETCDSLKNKSPYHRIAVLAQMWNSYQELYQKIYHLIKCYYHQLVDQTLYVDKKNYHYLDILRICQFYHYVIKRNNNLYIFDKNINDEEIILENTDEIVSSLTIYSEIIQSCSSMNTFTSFENDLWDNSTINLVNNVTIINAICLRIDTILKSGIITRTSNQLDEIKLLAYLFTRSKYLCPSFKKNAIIKMICYQKFLQTRIINLDYPNLDIEKYILQNMNILINADWFALLNGIRDIIQCRENNHIMHKTITDPTFPSKILNPIIIDRDNWYINKSVLSLSINYPAEIAHYLKIYSNTYQSLFLDKESDKQILWMPTMGRVKISANLNNKNITIVCNMLQAIALTWMNQHPTMNIEDFSQDTEINIILASNIIFSLLKSKIIGIDLELGTYGITFDQSYQGGEEIDIREKFIELFDNE